MFRMNYYRVSYKVSKLCLYYDGIGIWAEKEIDIATIGAK